MINTYIVQINKRYDKGNIKHKQCRLIEYNSLNDIHESIINDKRDVYSDEYLFGNLCPIRPNILAQEINENELLYVMELWDKSIMINQFIKLT